MAKLAATGSSKLFTILVVLPLGFVIGLMTAFIQAVGVSVFDISIPVGLVLAPLILIIAIRIVNVKMGSRYAGILLALGWLIATIAASFRTTAGDVILLSDPRTLAYLIICGLLGAAALSWPVIRG